MIMKMVVFWDVALCSVVEVYQYFRGAGWLPSLGHMNDYLERCHRLLFSENFVPFELSLKAVIWVTNT
jgi:hypothetical protein